MEIERVEPPSSSYPQLLAGIHSPPPQDGFTIKDVGKDYKF